VTHAVYAYEGDRAAVGVFVPVPGPGPNGEWRVAGASSSGRVPREAAWNRMDRSDRLLH
jgi:hypothetical protein